MKPSMQRVADALKAAGIDAEIRETPVSRTAGGPSAGARPPGRARGAGVEAADHLERFWFVRGLGLARWERWENTAKSRLTGRDRMAATIAESHRCPPIAFGEPPSNGWRLVDCRTWTNMVRAAPDAPLAALPWPAPELR